MPLVRDVPFLVAVLGAAVGSLIVGQAAALDIQASAEMEGRYSDNSRQAQRVNRKADTLLAPKVSLEGSEESSRINGKFNYQLEHRYYLRGTHPDDWPLTGTANLKAEMSRWASWTLDHTRTESTIDSGGVTTPENQQVTDTIKTGPTIMIPLGNWSIDAGAQGAVITAKKTANDSKRGTFNLGVRTFVAGGFEVGVSSSYSDVNFDSPLGNDYTSQRATLTAGREIEGGRLAFHGSLGASRSNRSRGKDLNGWIGSITGSYQVASEWELTFALTRDLTDQLSQNLRGTGGFGDNFNDDSTLADAFVSREGNFGLQYVGPRLTTRLQLNASGRAFKGVPQAGRGSGDQSRKGARLTVNYALTPRWDAEAYIDRARVRFSDLNRSDDEMRLGLRSNYEISPNLHLTLGASRRKRDSSTSTFNNREAQVNAILRYDWR